MAEILEFKRTQTGHGAAFCIACGHDWIAVAPTGVTELQCPKCLTMKGKYKFEFQPTDGQLVRACICTNQLFYLTPDGHMCANCGIYQRYDK